MEKRKSAEESEKERKRPKNVIKQEPGNVDQITRSRNELYSLFDEMHEPEDDVLEKPFIKYQQFITFLKVCCIFYIQGMVITPGSFVTILRDKLCENDCDKSNYSNFCGNYFYKTN